MRLVVGLGNPGSRYERTRHNVGFLVAEELARRYDGSLKEKKFRAKLGSARIGGDKVLLVCPQTFMNLSGDSISPLVGFHRIEKSDVVVVHDELDLPFGVVKVKSGGGHGGHNGLRDLHKKLGTGDYQRVRVGVGRPDGPMKPADYVLARWSSEQSARLAEVVERAADAVEAVLRDGAKEAMNRVNGDQLPWTQESSGAA